MGKAKKVVMKAMKKVMKAKKVSVVAKGKMARAVVFSGRKQKTASGLTKANLLKNKSGKIVSKSRSQNSKKAYANSAIKVGRRNEGGPQGLEPQGLRSHGWQDSTWQGALRQGQVAAQVNKAVSVRSCCPRWA